jgi:hypothetical protein
MASPDTTKPASGLSAEPVSGSVRLGSRIDPTINPSGSISQAPYPADTAGESDLEYFRRRPNVDSRNRVAFDGEPPEALRDFEAEIAFIRIKLKRDADGKPATIRREIVFGEWGCA